MWELGPGEGGHTAQLGRGEQAAGQLTHGLEPQAGQGAETRWAQGDLGGDAALCNTTAVGPCHRTFVHRKYKPGVAPV